MSGWEFPHRRYNPLAGEWVLVSPHRTDRPWLGERAASPHVQLPEYDPNCYLCPGNERAQGERNPRYTNTFAFDNDYAALLPGTSFAALDDGPLHARAERGTCRVVCFSPRHDLHLTSLEPEAVERVVTRWAQEYSELMDRPWISAVTIFENRGAAMGASNPHPHSQIWADETIPNEIAKESAAMRAHRAGSGQCLICDYVEREVRAGERIVFAHGEFVALVPFWAVWPFEVMIAGRAHRGHLAQLRGDERAALAEAMRDLVARYDRLFGVPFPYSMGFHQLPRGGNVADWHLHAHYYPPLLRSADVRKYMVGYEMLAQPQRDLTPESAASRLRDA